MTDLERLRDVTRVTRCETAKHHEDFSTGVARNMSESQRTQSYTASKHTESEQQTLQLNHVHVSVIQYLSGM